MEQKLIGKILPDLTEEHAIELAEVATGVKNDWYFAGIDDKGEQNQNFIISSITYHKEFRIYTNNRHFRYINLEHDFDIVYNTIELVDKMRELGYELKEE